MAQSKSGAPVVLIVENEPLLLMNAVDMIEDAQTLKRPEVAMIFMGGQRPLMA